MKKAFLIMASAMAFMSMVAAPGADKKDALKTPVSRADLVTQTERLMSALYSDGFGLDAEEYELLMGQEFDMLDDLAGSITMPTCAGEMPSLNSARPGKPFDPPIGPGPIRLNAVGGTGSGSFDQVGTARPDVVPSLNSARPGIPTNPPIGPGPIKTLSGCSSGSGNGNFDQVGTARPDVVPSLNGARPGIPTHPPIGPGPIKLNAVGGTGSGSFDQVGTARPDVVPSLNGSRPTGPTNPPIGPGPIKLNAVGCSGNGDFSGDSSFEDMIKGNTRPDVVPSLNSARPGKPFEPPIGPGPIRLNAVGGTGNGSFDQVGTARPDVVPSLNGLRPTGPVHPPIGPGPIKLNAVGGTGSGSFDQVGTARPDVVPSLNGSRPTKPIGPGPIDF